MADTVGEVRISTKLDNSGIAKDVAKTEKQIKRLTDSFDKETVAIQKQEAELAKLNRQMEALTQGDKAAASLTAMESQLKRVNKEIVTQEQLYSNIIERIQQAQTGLEFARGIGDTAGIQRQEQALKLLDEESIKFATDLENVRDKASDLSVKIEQIRLNPEMSREALDLADKISLTENKLDLAKNKANELKNALQQAYETRTEQLERGTERVNTNTKKASTNMFKLGNLTKLAGNRARHAATGFERLGKRIFSLISSVFVFNVLSKAMRGLQENISALLKSNQAYSNSLNNIAVNLLTAFAPIWQVIEPAFVRFIQLVEYATAAAARFIATMFGQTYEQARASAKSLYDETQAVKNLGKQTQKTGKFLASFDEINQQATQTAEQDTAIDFGGISEIDTSALDAFVDNITAATDKFFELGKSIAEMINNALGNINWSQIKNQAREIAERIASFLNGFVSGLDWDLLGKSIAEGINTALTFVYTFMSRFDWGKLGKSFATGLNSMIKTIDWKLAGKTLASGFVAAIDFLYDFVTMFDWRNLGASIATAVNSWFNAIDWAKSAKTLSEGIKGVFNSVIAFIQTVDWQQIGRDIATFLYSIDWGGIISGLFTLIGSIIVGSIELLWGYIQDAVTAISDYFGDKIEEAGGNVALGFLTGIGDIFLGIGKWINDNIVKPFINAFKKLFGIASPSKVMYELGINIVEGLYNGIVSQIKNIIKIFVDLWESIQKSAKETVQLIQKTWQNISTWFNQNVTTPISNFFVKLWNSIKSAPAGVVSSIQSAWQNLANWFNLTLITPIGNYFKTLWENIKLTASSTVASVQSIWQGVSNWFNQTVLTPLSTFFTNTWRNIQNIWGTASNWFNSAVWTPLMNGVKAFGNFFIGIWNGVINGFQNGINAIINGINSFLKGVQRVLNSASDLLSNAGIRIRFNVSTIPNVNFGRIPMLAQGAVIPPNAPFAAIVGDQKHGTNIEAPLDTIKQALAEVIAQMETPQPQVVLNAEPDMAALVRLIFPYLNDEKTRRGNSMTRATVTAI